MTPQVRPEIQVRLVRHDSELGRWEIAGTQPTAALRPYVTRYGGFDERVPRRLRRREVASPQVVLVIDFDGALRVLPSDQRAGWVAHRGGFVGGLQDGVTLTEHDGVSRGVIVGFTALGARLFSGRPLRDFARRTVDLTDLCGPSGLEIAGAIYDATTWSRRLGILDAWVCARIRAARRCPDALTEAVRRIEASGGTVEIGALAAALGCSRKHLHELFREELGLAPKLFGRIVRFARVARCFESRDATDGGRVAQACGYFDQAHMIRDFRTFAGGSPGDFVSRLRPALGGIRAD